MRDGVDALVAQEAEAVANRGLAVEQRPAPSARTVSGKRSNSALQHVGGPAQARQHAVVEAVPVEIGERLRREDGVFGPRGQRRVQFAGAPAEQPHGLAGTTRSVRRASSCSGGGVRSGAAWPRARACS